MATQRHLKRSANAPSRQGFSLIELMTVVLITGILAAIAIPTFSGYVFKSRTSEAVHFLGVIKLKQEAYRSEFGRYLAMGGTTPVVDPDAITFVPVDTKNADGTPHNWPLAAGDPGFDPAFNELGARPDGQVRFTYGWAAGTPADDDVAVLTTSADQGGYGLTKPFDHYFIAQAVSDLNDDGVSCTFEVTSFTRGVWFTPIKGWE